MTKKLRKSWKWRNCRKTWKDSDLHMNGQLCIREAGGWGGFYVLYKKCLISARVTHIKIDISSLRSYLLVFPLQTKHPQQVFLETSYLYVFCVLLVLHTSKSWQYLPVAVTALTQKNFPHARKAYSCSVVTWIWMTYLCELRFARKDLKCGDRAVNIFIPN